MVFFNSRSGTETGIPETTDDDENVELEKSNVLLMGPTGSGLNLCIGDLVIFRYLSLV